LIEGDDVKVWFPIRSGVFRRIKGYVKAVDGVSLKVRAGSTLGVVGESGSGKTTLGLALLRLLDAEGGIRFAGNDIAHERQSRLRPLRIHGIVPTSQIEARVHELLKTVGLVPAAEVADKYPHELSGGQRQRVAIARALAVAPKVVLADEPTSMLDVSIRIGILNLMLELKEQHDIAFLYVTHDLGSARYLADDILVMYAGQIVERGPIEQVLAEPLHPYTRLLLASVHGERIVERHGGSSAAVDPAEGCRFVARCPIAVPVCRQVTPGLVEARPSQSARCHVTAPSTD